jgi:hypothetical protein
MEGFQRHLVKMDVRLDSCADQLHITVNDKMKTLDLTCNYLMHKFNISHWENIFNMEKGLSLS